jgi:heterotetrameric sarcosine oxidase gamma subunit
VSSFALTPRSGLEHLTVAGRYGAPDGEPGVTLALRTDLALASVVARKHRLGPLARRVEETFGLELPTTPRRIAAGPVAFAWAGPGHWLASAEGMDGHAFEARLRNELAGMASVSDQSDGRIVLSVSGPKAREALAKGVMVDLHPHAFRPGDAAATSVAHVGVHFWQADAAPTYEFAVLRSFSAAFWEWLIASAAEFGVAGR